jgi:hypothetical protein
MNTIRTFRLVPLVCAFIGFAIHKGKYFSPNTEFVIDLLLILISLAALLFVKLKSPKPNNNKAQFIILSIALVGTWLIYLYYSYFTH